MQALVALRLLEVIKEQDVPPEVLEDEDPSVTMPRRLGLSGVVDRQIRTYREDARKRMRLPDSEIQDLFRLVIRRPDAEEVFLKLGGVLANADAGSAWRRRFPSRLVFALARRRVSRRLHALFGRQVGGFGRGAFSLEGRSLLFFQADPGGEACALVSGLCEKILAAGAGGPARVRHTLCQARGDDLCRWEGELLPDAAAPAVAPPAVGNLDADGG